MKLPPSTSMLDVLRPLLEEPGSDSSELSAALSIASARFEWSGGRLDRIGAQLSRSEPLRPSESSPTLPTTSPAS
jgi:hypothetical protein